MSFTFIVLGVILIWCVFYLKLDSIVKLAFFLGLYLEFVGCFFSNCVIQNVSINFAIFTGYLIIMFGLIMCCKDCLLKSVENVIYVLVIYVALNIVMVEFNSFFNWVPIVLIVLIINSLSCDNRTGILSINLSLGICELFNLFYMLIKMDFSVIYSSEFLLCFVLSNCIFILIWFVREFIKRGKYEKVG